MFIGPLVYGRRGSSKWGYNSGWTKKKKTDKIALLELVFQQKKTIKDLTYKYVIFIIQQNSWC